MKKVVLSVVAALAVAASAAPASAADMAVKGPAAAPPPPPITLDIAVGGSVTSDYLFRGISQSNKGPSGGAYFEPDLTTPIGTFYAGIAAWSIDWPINFGFTAPSAEVDFYGGWRNSWGPLSVDLGMIYYYYPSETAIAIGPNLFKGFDYYEIYGKFGYDLGSIGLNGLSIGANLFYTPNLLNYHDVFTDLAAIGAIPGGFGKTTALYYSGTISYAFPKWGDLTTTISGELGYWDIADSGFLSTAVFDGLAPVNPSYTYYNAGIAFGYKGLTLDLRYHGTDQSIQDCARFLLVSVPTPSNSWCENEFVATLKFDTSVGIGH